MLNFLELICLKCWNSNKLQGRGKTNVENLGASCFKPETLGFPIFAKKKKEQKRTEIVIKGLIMLEIQCLENVSKKLLIFIVKIS